MVSRDPGGYNRARRIFLKRSGLLGLGLAVAGVLPAKQAEAVLFGKGEYKITRTRLAMGTFVAMTAIHYSKDEAEHVIGLAFEEIERLSGLLSRYDEGSAVSELNVNAVLEGGPQEVCDVVARSLYFTRQTNGAFDITVKPLIDLYQTRFRSGQKPLGNEVRDVLERVGCEFVRLEKRNIRFTKPGMGITLDGIAKGYIVDRVSELLTAKGVVNHLVNAGGDIRTSGSAAKGKTWKIAVEDPAKRKRYPAIIRMTSGAIATSGNYEVFYDHEKMFHHIIDSRTGLSPDLAASVTVKAETVMDADALSTSVFVMQPPVGIGFIDSQINCECLVIGRDGSVSRSAGWNS